MEKVDRKYFVTHTIKTTTTTTTKTAKLSTTNVALLALFLLASTYSCQSLKSNHQTGKSSNKTILTMIFSFSNKFTCAADQYVQQNMREEVS
jgi:FtsH-binding integral membrane protein